MKPTPEQIAKLPKWARDYIKDLQREREVTLRTLNEFQDSDTPSPFYFEDNPCTGESSGPSSKRRYIQAHTVICEFAGVALRIAAHNYGNMAKNAIRLQWGSPDRSMDTVAMVPDSYQAVQLIAKENMR